MKSIGAGLDLPLSKFDLTLSAVETKTRLYCSLQYRTDMFDESTIRRLLENFKVLLQSIVDVPDEHVSALPILAAAEARRLIVEWNDTDREYPSELSVAQMFAAQAERTPWGIALVCRAQQISYRKLNERAGRLAGLLRSHGVRTEVLVGLFAEQSPEMIAGLLAVLKAGGAYLPLDPAASPQRLKSLLADAHASLVLTPAHLLSRLPEHTTAVVLLDEDDNFTAPESEAELAERGPAHAAYVIYVSDSQGRPRGIVIEDRQVVNSLQALGEDVSFAPGTSWAVQSPLTANSAQKLILASLCGGATLHVIAGDQATATATRDQHRAHAAIDGLLIATSQLVTCWVIWALTRHFRVFGWSSAASLHAGNGSRNYSRSFLTSASLIITARPRQRAPASGVSQKMLRWSTGIFRSVVRRQTLRSMCLTVYFSSFPSALPANCISAANSWPAAT